MGMLCVTSKLCCGVSSGSLVFCCKVFFVVGFMVISLVCVFGDGYVEVSPIMSHLFTCLHFKSAYLCMAYKQL